VDDDKDLNTMIRQYLAKKLPEFTVIQAFDGFEAGKLVAEEKPGVIILDIDLPGIDGHELCRRIKADTNLGSPKILSITGLPDPAVREAIIKEGADAFMQKPLNLDNLPDTILDLVSVKPAR